MLTRRQREEFGAYLRGLREASKKSLRQVHRDVGISPAYLAMIENAERNPPQPEFLRKLAACYGVSPVEVLRQAGYLEDEEVEETEDEDGESDLRWAYRAVMQDPHYRTGHSLSEEAPPEVMRFVVEMYERFTGKKLLGRRKRDTDEE